MDLDDAHCPTIPFPRPSLTQESFIAYPISGRRVVVSQNLFEVLVMACRTNADPATQTLGNTLQLQVVDAAHS